VRFDLYQLQLIILLTRIIEPAHTQVAENGIAYILSKLIKDGAFSDSEALLDYSYELIELAAEQGMHFLYLFMFFTDENGIQEKGLNVPPMERFRFYWNLLLTRTPLSPSFPALSTVS